MFIVYVGTDNGFEVTDGSAGWESTGHMLPNECVFMVPGTESLADEPKKARVFDFDWVGHPGLICKEVTLAPIGPDRSEFMRDAEAALRLGDPKSTHDFIDALCDRRAWVEYYDRINRKLCCRADEEALHASIKADLLRLCAAWGYYNTLVTHIKLEYKVKSPCPPIPPATNTCSQSSR